MHIVVVGDGGREQAIAWACRRHGHTVTVQNFGTTGELDTTGADLVIVGPEAALVAGVADECTRRGVPCFGPTAALARLESSKGWARDLATGLGIPGPTHARFDDPLEAIDWFGSFGRPVVVKLDGLAGGKGVVVPDGPEDTIVAIQALIARGPIVLEERLTGPECSLLALCDGTTARALPLAQDHKRIGEADTGLNTGGMGAYAPAPVPYEAGELVRQFVQPMLDHLAAAGTPYVGVLYAGLMLTPDGPRLIEYNCRFGDPEAQAVLPLLESDLAAHALACTRGALADERIEVAVGAAVTVVAAAAGYPEAPVLGADITIPPLSCDAVLFPAGMTVERDDDPPTRGPATDGQVTGGQVTGGQVTGDQVTGDQVTGDQVTGDQVTGGQVTGGRVLAVTGLGADLATARDAAYRAIAGIHFDGMQVRRDIGWRAPGALLTSYAAAGVDIDEGTRAVEQMRAAVDRTHGEAVLRGVGSFGGVFSAKELLGMDEPVLVASTDGVGTKVELAARLGMVRGVGHDIVNHCIDDVLVQSARPLFFLDYIAASRLDADLVAEVVTGMAEACEAAGCALLGGETAEMPGVYAPDAFDIAGTLVGVAERAHLLPRTDVAAGDVLIGVASSGPHTNGYSFLRKLFEWVPMDVVPEGFDRPLGETLLEPHRSYLDSLTPVIGSGHVKALAHITGGGLIENLPRVLPDGVDASIVPGSWPVPPLFRLVQELATGVDQVELHRMLNMGVGMVVVCAPDSVDAVQAAIAEPTWVIGHLVPTPSGFSSRNRPQRVSFSR